MSRPSKYKQGVTFIELLIDVAVISIVSVAILGLLVSNIKNASYSHLRFAAANLANQRMEEIRNLPYDQIATENGTILPQGEIKDSEDITFAGIPFEVHTIIIYHDDPYDDSTPTDTAPYDYKKATIKVVAKDRPVVYSTVTSNISAKAAETLSNTGILRVTVVDGLNTTIKDAEVTITNSHLLPNIHMVGYTDSQGQLMVFLLPPDAEYVVSATKSGYSTDTTINPATCANIPASPEATANPTIINQQLTDITLQIRCLVNVEINLVDPSNAPIPNYSVRVLSTRRTCLDNPNTPLNELKTKYDQIKTSDTNGHILIPQVENDKYNYENE